MGGKGSVPSSHRAAGRLTFCLHALCKAGEFHSDMSRVGVSASFIFVISQCDLGVLHPKIE